VDKLIDSLIQIKSLKDQVQLVVPGDPDDEFEDNLNVEIYNKMKQRNVKECKISFEAIEDMPEPYFGLSLKD